MSGSTFDGLPERPQAAVMQAVAQAGAFGRALENGADGEILQEMSDVGQIEIHDFAGRSEMLELVQPVQDAYAEELGATELLERIRGM